MSKKTIPLPNADNFKADALYLRELIQKIGISQREAARRLGVPERTLRDILNPKREQSTGDYPLQYALETWVALLKD